MAEPSGAVAPAAFLFHADELPDTKINVAVISGGNIDPALLAELRYRSNCGVSEYTQVGVQKFRCVRSVLPELIAF